MNHPPPTPASCRSRIGPQSCSSKKKKKKEKKKLIGFWTNFGQIPLESVEITID
jgi:hypothetical protein